MGIKKWFLLLLFLTACSITGNVVIDDAEMGESSLEQSELLFVEPSEAEEARNEFAVKMKSARIKNRELVEEYIDRIGANGILDGIEKVWLKCHDEAHDTGKVIFAKVKDIGTALLICADRCYSGCMHGVLMEAFAFVKKGDDHIDIEALKPKMDELCFKDEQMTKSYSPGDCAHGLGHAFMFLSGYDIREAVDSCKLFDEYAMKYYCASGSYMEYVTVNDKTDSDTKEIFYPCDSFDFPAACARYKMAHVVFRSVRAKNPPGALIDECKKLSGKFRLGCFHGLGNGYMSFIRDKKVGIMDVCGSGTEEEQFLCIEGAMERLAKYFPKRAPEICDELEGKNKETCDNAVNNGMYSMDKDFSLYQE